ncbi:MAG: RNA-directed DNA polymerase, partial [Chlamydiales bacterium]
NVYLHYVLDAWFGQSVLPLLGGRATLVRYADDFVIGFERRDEAERVMALLHERMASYGLTLHPVGCTYSAEHNSLPSPNL